MQNTANRMPNPIRHKGSKKLYRAWYGMFDRCGNPKSQKYERYNNAGIYVYSGWTNFDEFIKWSKTQGGYRPDAKFCRIDKTKPYVPGNCKWIVRAPGGTIIPNPPQRTAKLITAGEETKTLLEWSNELGLYPDTVYKWTLRFGDEGCAKKILEMKERRKYQRLIPHEPLAPHEQLKNFAQQLIEQLTTKKADNTTNTVNKEVKMERKNNKETAENREKLLNAAKSILGVDDIVNFQEFMEKNNITGRNSDKAHVAKDLKVSVTIEGLRYCSEKELRAMCMKYKLLPTEEPAKNVQVEDVTGLPEKLNSLKSSIFTQVSGAVDELKYHVDSTVETIKQHFDNELKKLRIKLEQQEDCLSKIRNTLQEVRTKQDVDVNGLLDMFKALEDRINVISGPAK